MTQRRWRTINGWVAMTGWDIIDQGHFLTVFTDDFEEDVVYSSIDDPLASDFSGSITLDRIFEVLQNLDIVPPLQLRDDLIADQQENRGNLTRTYHERPTMQSLHIQPPPAGSTGSRGNSRPQA